MLLETFGDYTLVQDLGDGNFGKIFLAEHRFLRKQYLLKEVPVCFSEGFEREILAIARLDHPHIVKVHNAFRAHEHFFIVSDLIPDATSLDQMQISFSKEETLALLRQVASALDYAHSQSFEDRSLFHGRLNLSNLFLRSSTSGLQIYLSDFGLGRLLGENSAVLQTRSFSFLSPEQKRSQGEKSDAKSDVYAFGALAHYLATGEVPDGALDPSHHFSALVQACLQRRPESRPSSLFKLLDEESHSPESSLPISFECSTNLKPLLRAGEIQRPRFDADPGAIFHRELSISQYMLPEKTELHEVQPLETTMAIIPGGVFERGSREGARDESPRNAITLSTFALDIHPVTNEQFVRFLQAMGGEKDHNNNDIIRLRDSRIKRSAGKLMIESGYTKHPVVGVTWYGASAYAMWVGKRLPTEAEWEIACCGGKEQPIYPTGEEIDRTQANFFSSDTTAVMSYPPNRLGLYDMAGNVYEWCHDWYAYNYYELSLQEPENPKGPAQGVYRVLRGGCWKSLKEDLRCSHRHRNNPGAVNSTYGFRCAADVHGNGS